jgi:hypothetical protein
MANGNLGSYAVTLPNIFQAPGQALESATQQIERQTEKMADRALREQEMAERKAERDETQMYRKMQTIQDLSDLSKYRTTSDVANAIGDKSAQDLRAKYIKKAQEGANPSDIMAEMGRDVSSVAQGMQAFKTESEMIEKRIADINKDLPNLDYGRAISDYRKEALGRRIKGSEFINPLEVPASNFATQLENPDFLSIYARGGKTLTEAIQAPKGLEKSSIFVGTPMENVRYDAQLPFWKRPTFKPEEAPGGFLPKGVIPKLELKADVLPAEAIKGSAKAPFKVIDEQVYNTFTQNPAVNIELIQATRQQYPQYDTFNQVEKNYAKRNVLYNKLSEIDQSDFSAAASTRAPITNVNIPKEEKGLEGLNWVKNFKTALESKDTGSAIAEARKLFAGAGGKYDFKDLKIASDGGLRFIYYDDYTGEDKDVKISPNDPNKYYKIANLYQNITGQDVKMERKVLGGKEDLSTPTSFSKDIELKINNVLKSNPGASRQEVINALKKAGKI